MEHCQNCSVDNEMLRLVYLNQWEQRWRGSRNQDWAVMGILATIAAAAVAIQSVPLEGVACYFKILLPLLVSVASIVALLILKSHQEVMNHANHIAKGIEVAFGIEETDSIKLDPANALFVGFYNNALKYPSKKSYINSKPIGFFWFLKKRNVQSMMGYFHLFFFLVFTALFILLFIKQLTV